MGTLQMHLSTSFWDKLKDSGLNIRRKHIRKNSFSLVGGEVTEFQLREKRQRSADRAKWKWNPQHFIRWKMRSKQTQIKTIEMLIKMTNIYVFTCRIKEIIQREHPFVPCVLVQKVSEATRDWMQVHKVKSQRLKWYLCRPVVCKSILTIC